MVDLGIVKAKRKTGKEPFHDSGQPVGFDVLSFWQWSASDLLSNATRGVLAEYIVAEALDAAPEDVRNEWAAFDLQTADGIRIEVKSAAYLQSWHQKKLSRISFRTPKTKAWDPENGMEEGPPARHADVYVFAVLAHKDKASVDPRPSASMIHIPPAFSSLRAARKAMSFPSGDHAGRVHCSGKPAGVKGRASPPDAGMIHRRELPDPLTGRREKTTNLPSGE